MSQPRVRATARICGAALVLAVACGAQGTSAASSSAAHDCTRGTTVFDFNRLPDGVKIEAVKGAEQTSSTTISMAYCANRQLKGGIKFKFHHHRAATGDYTIGYATRHACTCYSHGIVAGRVKGEKVRQLFHIAHGSTTKDPMKLTRDSAKLLNQAMGKKKHGPFDNGTIGRATSDWA